MRTLFTISLAALISMSIGNAKVSEHSYGRSVYVDPTSIESHHNRNKVIVMLLKGKKVIATKRAFANKKHQFRVHFKKDFNTFNKIRIMYYTKNAKTRKGKKHNPPYFSPIDYYKKTYKFIIPDHHGGVIIKGYIPKKFW